MKGANMDAYLVDPRPLLRFDFGPHHPFKIHRLGLTFELMEAYGLTAKEGVSLILPREATEEEAGSFHTKDYLEILRLAGDGIWISNLASYGLATPDNPIFPHVYTWGMLVAGSSIDAASAILEGGRVAFNFAGGLHHAMPSRASGFCHINDPVLAGMPVSASPISISMPITAMGCRGRSTPMIGSLRFRSISRGTPSSPGAGSPMRSGKGRGKGTR